MRRRLVIAAVAVLVVAVVAVGALVGVDRWQDAQRTDLERAASYAPADAQRLSWTDWAAVRDEVGARLDASSSGEEIEDFLDEAYEGDLSSASALVQSAPVLQAHFGFSPASADSELFSQSDEGAVVLLSMPDDTDFDAIGDQLEESGFTRPSADDGVWKGGDTLLPSIGSDLTPELQYVALDADEHLVLTSDTSAYLQQTVDDLGDDGLPGGMQETLSASGDPLTAAVFDGDYACAALSMGQADAVDQREADQLIAEAGEVNPVTGLALAVQPGGDLRVVLGFESEDQARTNADSRATLAAGPAPGQGGDFGDRFSVESATADGSLVTLDLKPLEGTYVFSDLSSGPVLFATC